MCELSLQLLFGLSIQLLCPAAERFRTQIKCSELLVFVGTQQQAKVILLLYQQVQACVGVQDHKPGLEQGSRFLLRNAGRD